MNAATLPCPTCSCTGTDTHEDRHTGTNMDTCRTCGGEGFIPARTGETAEASFQPPRAPHKVGDREGVRTPWKPGEAGYAREATVIEDERQIVEVGVTTEGRIDLIIHRAYDAGSFDDLTARLSNQEAGQVVAALIEAGASRPPVSPGPDSRAGVERVRHLKRGTEYKILFRGVELQTSLGMTEGETLVVYQGDDGCVWAREEAEFNDGRFAPIAGRAP